MDSQLQLLEGFCQFKSDRSGLHHCYLSIQLTSKQPTKSYGRWALASESVFRIEQKSNSDTKLDLIYYNGSTEDDDNGEVQESKIMDILSYGNETVEEITIDTCRYHLGYDVTIYLKTLLEHNSYGSLRKLTMEGEAQLNGLNLLSTLPQHSRLSTTPQIKFSRMYILEATLEALSRHLPSLEILERSNCDFLESISAPNYDVDIRVDMVDTDVGEFIISNDGNGSMFGDLILLGDLVLVIQTENPPLTKYYINARSDQRDGSNITTEELSEPVFNAFFANPADRPKDTSLFHLHFRSIKRFVFKNENKYSGRYDLIDIKYPKILKHS